LIEHWNGTSWSIVPSPNSGSGFNTLYSVAASSSSDVWAVGAYDSGAGVRTLTLHWDGNSWNTVPSPNPPGGYNEFYGVATAGPNDAWAVGYYNYNSAVYTLIAHWNGTSWTVVPSPAVSGSANLTAVGIAGPNDVWAVGGVDYWGQALIEHWNGSAWSVVANPTAGRLTGLAIRNSADIWAAGDFPSSASSTFTEHWDGSTWTVVPSHNNGANDNSLRGLTVAPAREAWSVGFYGADGAHAPLIERYYVSCTGLMPNLHESVSLNPLPTPTQTPNALGSRHK
jgi:hypothetical protein